MLQDLQNNAALVDEAKRLQADFQTATNAVTRSSWNESLQSHLTNVVREIPDTAEVPSVIDDWCQLFGLRYLPEPNWSTFTKTVAEDCETYARRYRITLGDAIAEWEGEDDRGSFGLTVEQAAAVHAYFVDAGRNLTEIPRTVTP
jgi:hypothetical protein